jgi:hypothetical protein
MIGPITTPAIQPLLVDDGPEVDAILVAAEDDVALALVEIIVVGVVDEEVAPMYPLRSRYAVMEG